MRAHVTCPRRSLTVVRRVPLPAETLITPEQFAEVLCDDLDLNPTTFVPAVAQSIRQQLEATSAETGCDHSSDQRVVIKVTSDAAAAGLPIFRDFDVL